MKAFNTTGRVLRAAAHSRAFSTSPRRLDNYGFIGLGQMGYQMAKNLQAKLSTRDTLRVYDIHTPAMKQFADEATTQRIGGAAIELAKTARDAANSADTVITVLPEPKHVRSVFEGMLAADLHRRDRLYIDCSTIDPMTSRQVAQMVADADQGIFVDAPMSGGVVGARAATLTFMLGAPVAVVPRAEAVLRHLGKNVLHCGPQGTGLSAKLANNYLLALNNIATAEAMNLGIRWGLDPRVLANVINTSTGRCWPSEANNPVKGVSEGAPAGRNYTGGFGIGLMKKDLRLAITAAVEADAHIELGGRAVEVYDKAEQRDDCQGRDFSVIYRYIGGIEQQ